VGVSLLGGAESLYETLGELRDTDGVSLSLPSAEFLALSKEPASNLSIYVDEHKAELESLRRDTVVTCMSSIQRGSHDPMSQSQLIVGTEAGEILVLAPTGTTVEARFPLPDNGVAQSIHVDGLWAVEHRISIVTRTGIIRTIRNGRLTTTILRTGVPITAAAALTSSIVAATMDGSIYCWHPKGRLLWVDNPDAPAVALCRVNDPGASREAVAVALSNGDIRLYSGGMLLHSTGATDIEGSADPEAGSPVASMLFGMFGKESRCLITAHVLGSVRVRVLPRRVRLDHSAEHSSAPPKEQDQPLELPKRTKLHVENVNRERAESGRMWRAFERDRQRIRLSVMREYVKTIGDGSTLASDALGSGEGDMTKLFAPTLEMANAHSRAGSSEASIRLAAQVLGLGPRFVVELTITSTLRLVGAGAWLVAEFDESQFRMTEDSASGCLTRLPPLPPKVPVVVHVPLYCVDPVGALQAKVRLMVLPPFDRDGSSDPVGAVTIPSTSSSAGGPSGRPIAAITITMPQSVEAEL
jgi:Bardet-Biedl syndrome 1 protein